jgi:hypothetical protein
MPEKRGKTKTSQLLCEIRITYQQQWHTCVHMPSCACKTLLYKAISLRNIDVRVLNKTLPIQSNYVRNKISIIPHMKRLKKEKSYQLITTTKRI